MAAVKSVLIILVLFGTAHGDFDVNNDGYRFIYHANKHLLVTVHGTDCYFATIQPHFSNSLISDFKTMMQEQVIAAIQDTSGLYKQATTIDEVRTQFNDTQADQLCHNQDIYIITPDFLMCDFENAMSPSCAWHMTSPNDMQWTVGQGDTPSILTGPSADHTKQNDAGKYLFIETNYGTQGDWAELVSPIMDLHAGLCLQFWYNMYGAGINTLEVSVQDPRNNHYESLWSRHNNQGQGWNLAEVSVAPAGIHLHQINWMNRAQIHIRATKGDGPQGDIAIDDISTSPGICTPSMLDCTFNRQTLPPHLCQWRQVAVFDQLDWLYISHDNMAAGAGPSNGGWNGHDYLLMNGETAQPGDVAELQSPILQRDDPMCLSFHYYMVGSGVGELDVILLNQKTQAETALWTKAGHLAGDATTWQQANVTVPSPGPDVQFQLLFRGTRGVSVLSDIAIDDVSFLTGTCDHAPLVG